MKTFKKRLCLSGLACALSGIVVLPSSLPAQPSGSAIARPPDKKQGSTELAIPIDQIAAQPDHARSPASLLWSPDNARIAWIESVPYSAPPRSRIAAVQPVQEIWALAPGGKPAPLLTAEAVRNALRGTNEPLPPRVSDEDDSNPWVLRGFAWSADNKSIFLFGESSIARIDLATGNPKLLMRSGDPLAGAALSPDGRSISFLRNHSLWLLSAEGGPAHPIAASPQAGILEGEPDWSYRNLFHVEQSYAWSPDSKSIAWLETDDRAVPTRTLKDENGGLRTISWPKPGGAIPTVRLLVGAIAGGLPVAVHIPPAEPPAETKPGSSAGWRAELAAQSYLPRFQWLPDSRHIAIERLARSQQQLDLYRADAATGQSHLLFSERDAYWINIADNLRFLADGGFLWTSERSGYRHLYHYAADGKLIAQLTDGQWEITSLDAVTQDQSNAAKTNIFFTATKDSPLERQLYSVSLDGGAIHRITQSAGTHAIQFASDGGRFADIYSNRSTQPTLALYATQAAESGAHDSVKTEAKELAQAATFPGEATLPKLEPVELAPFTLHMGQQTASLTIKPKDFDPKKRYPAILYLAGGPGEQLARDAWDGARGLWMQSMAEQGYLIFAIDNQGTAGRGHVFEEPLHLRLGAQEMVDQRDALNFLRMQPYIDPQRIGVCGWGYGGYLAVHAIFDRPVLYKASFAGAPIVDWRTWNAVFGERYLEDIGVRFHSWEFSAAASEDSGKFFRQRLMVAQGTEDEFAPLEQLFELQGLMVDRGKTVDTLLLPGRGHEIDDLPARKLLFSQMTEFFLKNL